MGTVWGKLPRVKNIHGDKHMLCLYNLCTPICRCYGMWTTWYVLFIQHVLTTFICLPSLCEVLPPYHTTLELTDWWFSPLLYNILFLHFSIFSDVPHSVHFSSVTSNPLSTSSCHQFRMPTKKLHVCCHGNFCHGNSSHGDWLP